MENVSIHQAEANLAQLLSRVEHGEEIVISDQGIPIAKLVPFHTSSNRRSSMGIDRGQVVVHDDFNNPLPEEILAAFKGGET